MLIIGAAAGIATVTLAFVLPFIPLQEDNLNAVQSATYTGLEVVQTTLLVIFLLILSRLLAAHGGKKPAVWILALTVIELLSFSFRMFLPESLLDYAYYVVIFSTGIALILLWRSIRRWGCQLYGVSALATSAIVAGVLVASIGFIPLGGTVWAIWMVIGVVIVARAAAGFDEVVTLADDVS